MATEVCLFSPRTKEFREISDEEIEVINRVKKEGEKLARLVEKLSGSPGIDQHWVNIGKTDLQRGLMALTRSVANPEFF